MYNQCVLQQDKSVPKYTLVTYRPPADKFSLTGKTMCSAQKKESANIPLQLRTAHRWASISIATRSSSPTLINAAWTARLPYVYMWSRLEHCGDLFDIRPNSFLIRILSGCSRALGKTLLRILRRSLP